MATRTSDTHPISVSWIAGGPAETGSSSVRGSLALCYCPGKKARRGGQHHERDLSKDLSRLRNGYKITTIVSLLNEAELRHLGVRGYEAAVQKAGMDLVSFPIIEMAAPEDLEGAMQLVADISQRLVSGQSLAMHCRGGVGRAGMMAACVLLQLGEAHSAADAIAQVRARRCPGAVESRKQEDFVRLFAERLSASRGQETKAS